MSQQLPKPPLNIAEFAVALAKLVEERDQLYVENGALFYDKQMLLDKLRVARKKLRPKKAKKKR